MEALIKDVPHGITIRTPTLDMTASWTFRLPFYEFENNLRLGYDPISLPSSPKGYIVEDQAADADIGNGFTSFQDVIALEGQLGGEVNSTTHSVTNDWTPDSSVLSALESVVPQPMIDGNLHGFPLTYLDIGVFTSPLHRQMLCSLANNSAGLDQSYIQDVIHFLQTESDEKLYQAVRSAKGYTARAIIQNLFKAAVEAGDARVVDILLRENPSDIKINEQFCIVDGEKYTPLERATVLRHEESVEIFLSHDAKVNRTYTYGRVGALDFAVGSPRRSGEVEAIPPHPRIFRKLLEKGGELCQIAIQNLITEDGGLAVFYISVQARKNAAQLCRWGVFCEAIMFMDDQSSMKITEIMLECSVDPNHDVDKEYTDIHRDYLYKVIDIAAQRGQLPIVDLLLKSGASLTGNTLPCATKSQNKDLIRLLLESGADINSIGSLGITTLSIAIELRDDHMIRFLEEQGASVIDQSKEHCSAAVWAASKAGTMQYLERLIQLGVRVSPKDLGYALCFASTDDRDEDVDKLIDAGADVKVDISLQDRPHKPPLYEVLARRKESLTFSLLNAGADPNFQCDLSSIQLAVEWGNRSVVEALIFAGADVNHCGYGEFGSFTVLAPLALAVKRRDFGLIELLLASGAGINSNLEKSQITSPLEVAAEIGDIDMARYLINRGADPNNPRALEKSFVKNDELFELLCQTFRARYPSARGNFGTKVLMHAIENENHDAIKRILQNGVNAETISEPIYDHGLRSDTYLRFYGLTITPLGYAIVQHKESVTEYLLQHGCDQNGIVLQFEVGFELVREPAISAAIATQRISMIELLINHKAKVNFPTFGPIKRTPLQKAAELGNIKTVTLLINNGADVNAPAARAGGGTSLQLAAIGGFIPVACKLLNHKADVNAPASKINGRTALEGAAEHGRLDMIKLLLNAGAGSKGGDEGQLATAIALARENGFYYICDLLESHFHRRQGQDSGLEMLPDGSYDDLPEWNLDDDQF